MAKKLQVACWPFAVLAVLMLWLLLATTTAAVLACGSSPLPVDADDPDLDGDGFKRSEDCDDSDALVNPGMTERDCDDGKDNDCDGAVDDDMECVASCDLVEEQPSNLGCEFLAADLPNFSDPPNSTRVAFFIANNSHSHPANITVFRRGEVAARVTVAPLQSERFVENMGRPLGLDTSPQISRNAYRIVSDRAISVYQHNSYDVAKSSSDVSLLLPTYALGRRYTVLDYDAPDPSSGFVVAIATADDTQVSIASEDHRLNRGEVVIVRGGGAGTSMTGLTIRGSKPISVFSGNQLANVPLGFSYGDHIEEQLRPVTTMGKEFVFPKTAPRMNCDPEDYLRVVAEVDGTRVKIGARASQSIELNRGEWHETTTKHSITIGANHPVSVVQYLKSSGLDGVPCDYEGDPSMIGLPSVTQYRSKYVFTTPPTFVTNYIAVIAKADTEIVLDGQTLPRVGERVGEWQVSMHDVKQGAHVLTATEPVGVVAYGLAGPKDTGTANTSYGYVVGINLPDESSTTD